MPLSLAIRCSRGRSLVLSAPHAGRYTRCRSIDTGSSVPPRSRLTVMTLWKHSRKDAILVAISVAQFAVTFTLAGTWHSASLAGRIAGGVLLTVMMTYNI